MVRNPGESRKGEGRLPHQDKRGATVGTPENPDKNAMGITHGGHFEEAVENTLFPASSGITV